MTGGDVYDNGMDDQPTFEDPELADVIGDARAAYGAAAPAVSPALASLFEREAAHPRSPTVRRTLAQLIAATTAVVAATGGLAIAGALPGSMQDAVSSALGSEGDEPIVDDSTTTTGPETTTTTSPGGPTTTTTAPGDGDDGEDDGDGKDNHGAEVSAVAHDKTLHGCEHGQAVSEVASGKVKDKVCKHSSSTTTTTVDPGSDEGDETEAPETDAPEDEGSDEGNGRGNGRSNGHGNPHDD